LDFWTAETLRQMVAYIGDDAKIAIYLGITEKTVRAARLRLRKGRPLRQDTHGKEPKERPAGGDRWERDLSNASRKLAEAIEAARG
jgi:hypothetical protein